MEIVIGLIEHLGDIVACEPVARYLKVNYPDSRLTWVVSEKYRELVDVNPHIDEVLAVECLTDWIKLIKHNSFDKVVDLHVNLRVCEHCRVPLVKTRGNPFVSVYEWFDYGALLEAFSLGAGLPKLSGQPRLYLGPEHVAAVDTLILPSDFCVIHRESNTAQKDWTDDGWAELSAFIRAELGLEIVEVGGGKLTRPSPLAEGFIDLFNRLPILQTAEVIRRARLFIGIDSGPAHLANAVRTPGVVLLGRHSNFRQYMPFTGFYASADPAVKIVRNLVGDVRELGVAEVAEAVCYVAEVSRCYVRPAEPEHGLGEFPAPTSADPDDCALVSSSELFDAGWYYAHNPEATANGLKPVEHFLLFGGSQKKSPGPDFDADYYLAVNPDVAAAGVNPLVHYIQNGEREGRKPHPPIIEQTILPALDTELWGRAAYSDHASLSFRAEGPGASGRPSLPDDEYPRTFAFYLPQFHPIPENNWAHGMGFTEWHNVIQTKPLFKGHYQPRIPGELGFYDLRAKEVLETQINLAKEHGISGFCFYYYYFQGKRLLFDPIKNFLESDSDFPFMLLWANENWSKKWDGGDKEVIIAQNHSKEDDLIFLRNIAALFADPRYAKVNGKPILMVYKAHLFPDVRATTETWRREIEKLGFPGIYLVMADDWTDLHHPRDHGFDASYEIPSNLAPDHVLHADPENDLDLPEDFTGRIIDYAKFAQYHLSRPFPSYKRFRTVMLPWDNTARYGLDARVHINAQGADFRLWLLQAILDSYLRYEAEERIVFLHSWNEWCEGTYLEPDRRNGRWFLEETRAAIKTAHDSIEWAAANPSATRAFSEFLKILKTKDEGTWRLVQAQRDQIRNVWRELEEERRLVADLRREGNKYRDEIEKHRIEAEPNRKKTAQKGLSRVFPFKQ